MPAEIDNIVLRKCWGLFDDQRHSNAFGRFALDGAKHLEVADLHNNISIALGRIGSEVNNAEHQKDINLDNEVRLKQFKSSEVDVDFAEAVSRFNAELARLEAAQASFAKISQLSLFEYIR